LVPGGKSKEKKKARLRPHEKTFADFRKSAGGKKKRRRGHGWRFEKGRFSVERPSLAEEKKRKGECEEEVRASPEPRKTKKKNTLFRLRKSVRKQKRGRT